MLPAYISAFQIMPKLTTILLIFVVTFIDISTVAEYCDKTIPLLSKCYSEPKTKEKYQWLVEVPKSEESCDGKKVPDPQVVPCDFNCGKGKTFDRTNAGCKLCPKGTFSLGGGQQYTFNNLEDIKSLPKELSTKAESSFGGSESECKKRLWQIKGNVLQGDVQPNCIISITLRFKLVRAGAIIITYNLPTSIVIGTITSRCDFSTDGGDDDDVDDDTGGLDREKEFSLRSTGYGTWKERSVKIDDAGDYELTLFTMGVNAFHFPFAIRSIVVEGSASIQDCITCPPGTYSSKEGSATCTPCPANQYAADDSKSCEKCPAGKYSDEGSTDCLPRPTCEAKHYRKIFTGCDTSDTASIKYEPIQPKICTGGGPPTDVETSSCGTCNPGMYKNKASGKCEFCPAKTYSNGTLTECKPCGNELSLLPGLYYRNWNELPIYLNRSYLSFGDPEGANSRTHSHSWIPSITYISSQALPDTLSLLSLQINEGFRESDIAKTMKEYGRLYFKFSTQCQSTCSLFLVSQDIFSDSSDNSWEVLSRWTIDSPSNHKNITEYSYSIQHPDPIIYSWMFTSDDTTEGTDEIRIYEIRVTNTKLGGSDRCVTCLNLNNQETECKACTPGNILSNNTCVPCPPSSIASRVRPTDPVPTICRPCPNNTISDDGVSCYVPCKQSLSGPIEYDLQPMSTIEFHGSKLFTQKGSGYFHVFNASICGKTNVICTKTSMTSEGKRSSSQTKIESKLCRMGSVPDKNENLTAVAYIDDFGEQLSNISLTTLKYFPPLRSDYNLTDITLVYRANASSSQSFCSEHITYLSLRCDHTLEDKQGSPSKYQLQTPNDCSTGTCDGCTFYFLLRTPLACPNCDKNSNGYRDFVGPCKFGRQEVRKIPYPYCTQNLTEQVEIRRCSILSIEIQIILALFLIIAGVLIAVVVFCWRKNRKLEYRYMQLIENNNPDDDTAVDNVCAQLSDEDDEGEEVQFQSQSKAKKILNVVRNAIRKNPSNGQSDDFRGDSFLLTNTSAHDA